MKSSWRVRGALDGSNPRLDTAQAHLVPGIERRLKRIGFELWGLIRRFTRIEPRLKIRYWTLQLDTHSPRDPRGEPDNLASPILPDKIYYLFMIYSFTISTDLRRPRVRVPRLADQKGERLNVTHHRSSGRIGLERG